MYYNRKLNLFCRANETGTACEVSLKWLLMKNATKEEVDESSEEEICSDELMDIDHYDSENGDLACEEFEHSKDSDSESDEEEDIK